MTDFLEIARSLEMVREDRKWYENVEAVADAIELAFLDGIEEGRKQRDEYAPPAGPIEIETPGTSWVGVAMMLPRDFSPVPQPDGDCRFPSEAE